MSEGFIVGLLVALHGSEAPGLERMKADQCKERGDERGANYHARNAQLAEEKIASDRAERIRKERINPEHVGIHGGLTGIRLSGSEFEIADGAVLKPVYVHVMAPYLLAFNRPVGDGPHPAPWRSASGGLGFDVEVQFSLRSDASVKPLSRLESLWWLVALLRLHHPIGIRMPVISDTEFGEAIQASKDPVFWPAEVNPRHFEYAEPAEDNTIPAETFDWLKTHFGNSGLLLSDDGFLLAIRALDACHSADTAGSAMLLIWSALESLYRPGQPGITKKLSACIATHLSNDLSERDKLYAIVKDLYGVRSEITHAAKAPHFASVQASFLIAQKSFIRVIEEGALPSGADLLDQWKRRLLR